MTKSEAKFNELKDRYVNAYKRVNNNDVNVWFEAGFVHIKSNGGFSVTKVRVGKFEEMTSGIEKRPNYVAPKLTEKKVFEKRLNPEEAQKEDGGQAIIFTVSEPFEEENGMFVRIQSWDDKKEHTDLKKFEGRKIRITIETID